MTEAKIISYCKKGDPRGFRALVDTYSSRLMGVSLRYMKDEFSAKDVLQESFIRIFKSIGKYKNTGSFDAWLNRIVVTSALMEIRKNSRSPFHVEIENGNEKSLNKGEEVEMRLNEEDILEMIFELPDHYRVIFNLYVVEGFTHAEIASLLNISESTSRTKLTRARRKMQEIYRKHSASVHATEKEKEISKIS